MDGYDNCFFFSQTNGASNVVDTTTAVVALARKLHSLQRHKDREANLIDHEIPAKSESPLFDSESHDTSEHRKTASPLIPSFSSTWNPDEQPLKFIFDKHKWESVRLLSELAFYLYGFSWSSASGGNCTKLHPRLIQFLQFEYDELTEGCSVVYYRWQSKKYQERYLAKLRNNGHDHEVAPSIAASNLGRGLGASGTGGSSSSLLTAQHQQAFRNRLGSANSITIRSERSNTTGTNNDSTSARQNRQRRKDENQSTARDRYSQARVQFLWSSSARQREKDLSESAPQPILTTSVSTNALISVDAMPPSTARRSAREPPPSLPLSDVYRSVNSLKRMIELFREMTQKRELEDRRWLENGRIYACRVICHGDRRSALMSRSKSAAIPTSSASISASAVAALPTAPKSAVAHPASAKPTRASTAPFPQTAKSVSENENETTTPSAFSVLSSLNTSAQQQTFHIQDALQGKVPRFMPHSKAYKRSIFMAALPDGSYSAYYPTGKPAVVQSCYLVKTFPSPSHTTTLAYDHTAVGDIVLVATPTNLYAYAPKYDKRLFADRKNLTIITAEITVESHPDWHRTRCQSAINFEINDHLMLAFYAPDRITLTFYNQTTSESFKFALGFNLTAPIPAAEVKHLQTQDIEFQSKSAFELVKASNKVKTVTTSQQHRSLGVTMSSRSNTLTKSEQIAKKLGFIDNSYTADVSAHLKRLKNKVSWICESWLSHYCLWLNVVEIRGLATDYPAARLFNRRSAKRMQARSAGLPSTYSFSDDEHTLEAAHREGGADDHATTKKKRSKRSGSSELRLTDPSPTPPSSAVPPSVVPSVEPPQSGKLTRTGSVTKTDAHKPHKEATKEKEVKEKEIKDKEKEAQAPQEAYKAPISVPLTEVHMIGVCPASLRRHMTAGGLDVGAPNKFCHCSRRKPPIITDSEYELYVQKFAPQNQMLVIFVTDSRRIDSMGPCSSPPSSVDTFESIFEELYSSLSLYRPRPCVDSISDRFRLCRYDLAAAVSTAFSHSPPSEALLSSSSRRVPLLIRRHNVRRGMTLMYHGGRLISCGFISPSTTEALLRQIESSWRLALRSFALPADFRINLSASSYCPVPMAGITAEIISARGRQADAFVARYVKPYKVASAEAGVQRQLTMMDEEDAIKVASFTAREGPHSARDFPCLHVPTL